MAIRTSPRAIVKIPAWRLIAVPGEEKPRPARGSSSLARSDATAAGGACRALRLFDRAPDTHVVLREAAGAEEAAKAPSERNVLRRRAQHRVGQGRDA